MAKSTADRKRRSCEQGGVLAKARMAKRDASVGSQRERRRELEKELSSAVDSRPSKKLEPATVRPSLPSYLIERCIPDSDEQPDSDGSSNSGSSGSGEESGEESGEDDWLDRRAARWYCDQAAQDACLQSEQDAEKLGASRAGG